LLRTESEIAEKLADLVLFEKFMSHNLPSRQPMSVGV